MRDGIGEMAGGLVFSAAAAGILMVGWLAVRGSLPVFDGTGFVGTLPGRGGARGVDGGRGAGVVGVTGGDARGLAPTGGPVRGTWKRPSKREGRSWCW